MCYKLLHKIDTSKTKNAFGARLLRIDRRTLANWLKRMCGFSEANLGIFRSKFGDWLRRSFGFN